MELNILMQELEDKERSVKSHWHRTLPRAELLNDRWEKAKRLGFEEGANIYDTSYVFGNVMVGEKTWIGPFTILDGTGNLTIGKYCNISSGVQIYTHSSLNWVLTGGNAHYDYAKTSIGDFTYIGSQSIIDKGVSIGSHCIVGANSYVNKSFPDFTVIAGTPAKQIGVILIDQNNEVKIEYIGK